MTANFRGHPYAARGKLIFHDLGEHTFSSASPRCATCRFCRESAFSVCVALSIDIGAVVHQPCCTMHQQFLATKAELARSLFVLSLVGTAHVAPKEVTHGTCCANSGCEAETAERQRPMCITWRVPFLVSMGVSFWAPILNVYCLRVVLRWRCVSS
jgi:hypothetical protein